VRQVAGAIRDRVQIKEDGSGDADLLELGATVPAIEMPAGVDHPQARIA